MKINYSQIITLLFISFNISASDYEVISSSGITNGYINKSCSLG